MSLLRDKNVILGVSASIAAYKSVLLVREFVKLGANVRVIMTPDAKQFVTPLTLSTLSKNPVLSTLVKEENNELWNNHVELGLWADLMIIAPATAKTLFKMAHGECDNLLLSTYLSANCPVFFLLQPWILTCLNIKAHKTILKNYNLQATNIYRQLMEN
jgi:phosphopantothenoylcysteine decarboxylase/phosphopantothenate--cysteine ligase